MTHDLPIPWIIKADDSLANGRGMTDCELVGISGGCGINCPALLAGNCETEDEMMEDNKYYCPGCDWFYMPSEVKEQTDGISDTPCPDCGKPLQEEGE